MTLDIMFWARVGWWEKVFHERVSGCDDTQEPTERLLGIAAKSFRCLPGDVRIVRVQYLCTSPDKETK